MSGDVTLKSQDCTLHAAEINTLAAVRVRVQTPRSNGAHEVYVCYLLSSERRELSELHDDSVRTEHRAQLLHHRITMNPNTGHMSRVRILPSDCPERERDDDSVLASLELAGMHERDQVRIISTSSTIQAGGQAIPFRHRNPIAGFGQL